MHDRSTGCQGTSSQPPDATRRLFAHATVSSNPAVVSRPTFMPFFTVSTLVTAVVPRPKRSTSAEQLRTRPADLRRDELACLQHAATELLRIGGRLGAPRVLSVAQHDVRERSADVDADRVTHRGSPALGALDGAS